jgi:DNA glycosylase AlkZ-like
VAGLQSQYAPTMYVGLWSRVDGFQRDDLTAALHRREVVQATLMRATIHLVAAADYWPMVLAIRPSRQRWWLQSTKEDEAAIRGAAERVRVALDVDEQLTRKELDQIAGKNAAGAVGIWLDLVRVPPSGTWERRRADVFAAATDWVGPEPDLAYDDAVDHLVKRYLTGFGPATVHEIANWAGMPVTAIGSALERTKLRRFRTDDGQTLVDLPRLPLPDPDKQAPVRFLSTWEAILLTHARRAVVLREDDRSRIFNTKIPHSMNTFLVDGAVEGTWRYQDGRVEVSPWRPLDKRTMTAVTDEAERAAAFHR